MKILLAVDKESAKTIVDFLRKQEWEPETDFRVITVFDTDSQEYINAERSSTPLSSERALGEKLESLVNSTAASLEKYFPNSISSTCVLYGDAAAQIAGEAKYWGADMIAIGSHHKHGADKFIYGSVSESVLHCSSCSILIVPVHTKCEAK